MAKDYLSMVSPSPSDAEHHGVKGMKWGIRKSPEAAAAKATKKADKKYEKQFQGINGFIKVNNQFADHLNPKLEELNNTPAYKDKNLYQDKKLHDKYWNDVEKLIDKAAAETTASFGTNASGTRQMEVTRVGFGENASWNAEVVDIQHADTGPMRSVITPVVNELGQVVDLNIEYPSMSHFDGDGGDFLAHYGVPGMKWGIRKPSSSAGSTSGGSTSKSIPKAPANETHGQKYDRLRMQVKTHGTNSLSQEELNFVNARTEAIAKINKMNVSSPGWLTDASKVVLQETTKTLMKDLAVKAGKQFIVKPLITGK